MSKTNMQRRGFLAGLGATIAGGAVALTAKIENKPETVGAAAMPEAAKGYQATEHVKKYYRTAKV